MESVQLDLGGEIWTGKCGPIFVTWDISARAQTYCKHMARLYANPLPTRMTLYTLAHMAVESRKMYFNDLGIEGILAGIE